MTALLFWKKKKRKKISEYFSLSVWVFLINHMIETKLISRKGRNRDEAHRIMNIGVRMKYQSVALLRRESVRVGGIGACRVSETLQLVPPSISSCSKEVQMWREDFARVAPFWCQILTKFVATDYNNSTSKFKATGGGIKVGHTFKVKFQSQLWTPVQGLGVFNWSLLQISDESNE